MVCHTDEFVDIKEAFHPWDKSHLIMMYNPFFFFCLLPFSRATPMAYEGSQARGLIRAVAAGLRQSHSNVGSEPHL